MQTLNTKEKWQRDLHVYFPQRLSDALLHMESAVAKETEEIRVRANNPLAVGYDGKIVFIQENGAVTNHGTYGLFVTPQECMEVLSRATKYSVYALEEELRSGFVTVSSGYRIGIGGHAVVENGKIKLIAPCSALNIRIARQIIGAADTVMPYINAGNVQSTLVLSPPGRGKTTLLRDIARQLSKAGYNVAVADERNEISGCVHGAPQYDIGYSTDVVNSGPKAQAMMVLLRGMSPQVIITDEIGSGEDASAIEEAVNAGVAVIASAHAQDTSQAARRPHLQKLMEISVFNRIVVLSAQGKVGTVEGIYDAEGNRFVLQQQGRVDGCFVPYVL